MTNQYNYQDRSVKIHGNNINSNIDTGNKYFNNSSELKETVKEIQQLIEQLSQRYSTLNTAEKMKIAAQTIETIECNTSLKPKVIKACKQGLLETLKTNPIGAFVVGAIESWN